jgi:aminoglycoside phosphotransferase
MLRTGSTRQCRCIIATTRQHDRDLRNLEPRCLVVSLRERTQSSEFEQIRDGESPGVVFAVRSAGGALTEFVKIDSGSATEPIRDEYEALRYLQHLGVAAPTPIEFGTWSGLEWMRTTAINGIAFEDMRPDRAIVALADLLRGLHSLPTDGCPFQRRTRSLVTAAQHAWDRGLVGTISTTSAVESIRNSYWSNVRFRDIAVDNGEFLLGQIRYEMCSWTVRAVTRSCSTWNG